MKKLFAVLVLFALVLVGCGGGGGGSTTTTTSTTSAPANPAPTTNVTATANTVAVTVDHTYNISNAPYVSVTVCQPNTTNCAIIDHVLLDTGSSGLRLLKTAIPSTLTPVNFTDPNTSEPLAECGEFGSGFTWGPISTLDIKLAGETASSMPVQIIDSTYSTIPTACSSFGTDMGLSGTASLYAKGILGVGLMREDCGAGCVSAGSYDLYYACASGTCSLTPTALTHQVRNPVTAFASDNNGVILNFPVVPQGGAATVTGTLTIGINTRSNNVQPANATKWTTDSVGDITADYTGSYLTSFFDSGSSTQFVPDNTITQCGTSFSATPWFCPTSEQNLSATLIGYAGETGIATFSIGNVQTEFTAHPTYAAFFDTGVDLDLFTQPMLDFGMPFFYGRTIYFGIQGNDNISLGQWPYFAVGQ
jgi:hypothetical protein